MTPNEIITEALYNIYGASTPDASVQTRASSVLKRLYDQVQRKVPWWFLERQLTIEVAEKVSLKTQTFERVPIVFQRGRVVVGDRVVNLDLGKTPRGYSYKCARFNETSYFIEDNYLYIGGINAVHKINMVNGEVMSSSIVTIGNSLQISLVHDSTYIYSLGANQELSYIITKISKENMVVNAQYEFTSPSPPYVFSRIILEDGILYINPGEYGSDENVAAASMSTSLSGVSISSQTCRSIFIQGEQVNVSYFDGVPPSLSVTGGPFSIFVDNAVLNSVDNDDSYFYISYTVGTDFFQRAYNMIGELVWENVNANEGAEIVVDGIGYGKSCTINMKDGSIVASGFDGGDIPVFTKDDDHVYMSCYSVADGLLYTFTKGVITASEVILGGIGKTTFYAASNVETILGIVSSEKNRLGRMDLMPFHTTSVTVGVPAIYAEDRRFDDHFILFKPFSSGKETPYSVTIYYLTREEYNGVVESNTLANLEDYLIKKLTAEISLMTEYADRYSAYSQAAELALQEKIAENCKFTAQEFELGYADV